MRSAPLIFVILCCTSVALANNRQWKDAKVINITSGTGGAVAAPIGTMMVGVPIG